MSRADAEIQQAATAELLREKLRQSGQQPVNGQTKSGQGDGDDEIAAGPHWPAPLAPEAFYGLAGKWVKLVEPETEADPAVLLLLLLAALGNLIGRGPHFRAEEDRHFTILYTAIVGRTAKARKGTAEGRVRRLLEILDPDWARRRIKSGMSTGEGLVYEVRDARGGKDADAGENDKRLLIIEPEFAGVLSVSERPGNTLSPTVRRAWDSPALLAPMTKTNRCEASNPHISVVAQITLDELRRMLTDTAKANGFGNRFLWACASRSKCLPDGGCEVDVKPLAARLRAAVDYAQTFGEVGRDESGRAVWHRVYRDLSEGRPGLLGAVTARAEAQVMRLALLYALLDQRDRIGGAHLLAALAVWQYCLDSARYIFGDSLGDKNADEILRELRSKADGMTRTAIREHFGRNLPSAEIGRALGVLAEHGLASFHREDSGGRPIEVWQCTR